MSRSLSRALAAALILTFALGPTPAPAAPARPVGQPLLVSPADSFDHSAPDVAADATGGAVVVWQATNAQALGSDIFARRLSRDGAPVGEPFRVNATTAGEQRRPAVALLAGGGFVVVWDTNTSTLAARRFAADGTPVDPADLPITAVAGDDFDPDVVGLPDGGFVVAWQFTAPPSSDGILLRRFGPTGAAAGAESSPYLGADQAVQANPALAATPGGALAVVWEELSLTSGNSTVRLTSYDAAGAAQSQALAVADSASDELRDPAVALAATGAASIVWATLTNGLPAASRVDLRQFDAAGAPLGQAVTLSAPATATRSAPALALGAWGALAAWADATTTQAGAPVGLVARALDPAGTPAADELYPRLPSSSPDAVSLVAAAPTATGAWVVWGQDAVVEGADLGAIYARRVTIEDYRVALPLIITE